MPRSPIRDSLVRTLESDTGFYYLVGLFTILVFLGALVGVWIVTPGGLDSRGLAGLVVGFFLFMLVYFVSIVIQRVEEGEDL